MTDFAVTHDPAPSERRGALVQPGGSKAGNHVDR
jgi:hypothetical protein